MPWWVCRPRLAVDKVALPSLPMVEPLAVAPLEAGVGGWDQEGVRLEQPEVGQPAAKEAKPTLEQPQVKPTLVWRPPQAWIATGQEATRRHHSRRATRQLTMPLAVPVAHAMWDR